MQRRKSMMPLLMAAGACLFFGPSPAHAAEPGLVAHWTFDEGSGTTAADATGQGHDTQLNGGHWVPGRRGGHALSFDGAQDRALVAHGPWLDAFPSGITVAAWVYRDGEQTDYRLFFGREIGGTMFEYFAPCFFKGRATLILNPDGTHPANTILDGGPTPVRTWLHLAATWDGQIARLYVNGKQVAEGLRAGRFVFVDRNPLILGANSNDRGASYLDHFGGRVDDLRVYDRALPPSMIARLAR